MQPYLVISADCHAGPNSPAYREFLDPQYRDEFDDELAERQRSDRRASRRGRRRRRLHGRRGVPGASGSARTRRATASTRSACAAAGTPRRATRSSTTTASPARSCSPGPTPPPARWARRSAPASTRSPPTAPSTCSPAHARTTAGRRELCQDEPGATRRADRRADPRRPRRRHRRDPPRARRRPHRRHHHPAAVGRARVVHELPLRPGVGGVRGARSCRCTATRAPRAHEDYGEVSGWMSVYGYETIFFTARPLWFMLLTGVFERFPRLKMAVTEAGSFWAADLLWRVDMMATREHGMRKMVNTRGILTMLPSEYFDRNIKIGVVEHASARARPALRDRRRQHHVGQRLPAPRGHVAVHARVPARTGSGTSRSTRPSRSSGSTRPTFYGFDLDKLAADRRPDRAHARGPRPDRRVGVREVGAVQEGRAARGSPVRKPGALLTDE